MTDADREAIYFGTTQQCAGWLLDHEAIREQLVNALQTEDQFKWVTQGFFRQGPIRMIFDKSTNLVSFWNIDYLTGLSDEGLGFIKLTGSYGLFSIPQIAFESFERALTVLSYRLRNLIFDKTYYHQDFEDGSHKVLAGRGSVARGYSIGYVEQPITLTGQAVPRKVVMSVGPEQDWRRAGAAAIAERDSIPILAEALARALAGVHASNLLLTEYALATLRRAITPPQNHPPITQLTARAAPLIVQSADRYRTAGWSYNQWVSDGTMLSSDQINILCGDSILAHPIRIIGPAGAGKTLLMQLMAMRLSQYQKDVDKILFVTHNAPMEVAIRERFSILGADQFSLTKNIAVTTLERYARETLNLKDIHLLESTVSAAKATQLSLVKEAFRKAADERAATVSDSEILQAISGDLDTFGEYLRSDFSVAIKAQNLQNDKAGYVNASVALGKLHGILSPDERDVIYLAFQMYQAMLDELGVLDTDDVALSVLAQLTSPVWHHQRRALGFDFVFVDEAQLFNENERKIFQYLSNGKRQYVPIALALDEGQQFFGESRIGLALLGIKDAERGSLGFNHRMSGAIAALAFSIISQSTELFNLDFPDYTKTTRTTDADSGEKPKLFRVAEGALISNLVAQRVREYRRSGMKRIAIVSFNEAQWPELAERLRDKLSDLDFSILLQRGERPPGHAYTTLCRPSIVGGQEFDAVVAVGMEQGVLPKNVSNPALQVALEQQGLRDAYVAVSRAREHLSIVIGVHAEPAPMLQEALKGGLVEPGN